MIKKQKKASSKVSQAKIKEKLYKKYILFFGIVILLGALYLTLFQTQYRQTYEQHAQSATCGAPGDLGNDLGVGKYCTQGGGQCQGLNASICSADIQLNGSGICSKACNTDADCGTGAVCYQDTLGKGCEPVSCQTSPTPSASPTTSPVPSTGCLGPGCVTPTVSPAPSTSTQPSQAPVSPTTTPAPSTGGGNFFSLLISFIVQIIQFFINLFKSL